MENSGKLSWSHMTMERQTKVAIWLQLSQPEIPPRPGLNRPHFSRASRKNKNWDHRLALILKISIFIQFNMPNNVQTSEPWIITKFLKSKQIILIEIVTLMHNSTLIQWHTINYCEQLLKGCLTLFDRGNRNYY